MYCNVLILSKFNKSDFIYTYLVPSNLEDSICLFDFVIIPLSSRLLTGIVLEKDVKPDLSIKYKEIIDILKINKIDKSISSLISYIYNYNFVTYFSIYNNLINKYLKEIPKKYYVINCNRIDYPELNDLFKKDSILYSKYKNNSIIKKYLAKKLVIIKYLYENSLDVIKDKYYFYKKDIDYKYTTKDLKIIEYIKENNSVLKKELINKFNCLVNLNKLYKLGTLGIIEKDIENKKICFKKEDNIKDFDKLNNIDYNKYNFYIFKTNNKLYYINLLKKIIFNGGQALIIIPNIISAKYIISLFKDFNNIYIFNQFISINEQKTIINKLLNKEDIIVIGSSESLFLPFYNIKCIVLDGIDSMSYQYHKDKINIDIIKISKKKSSILNIPIILNSSCPMIEYMYYALESNTIYEFDDKPNINMEFMPTYDIDDKDENHLIIPELRFKINKTLNLNKKVLIVCNQNGYNSEVLCPNCLHIQMCLDCKKKLVYYKELNCLKCPSCLKVYKDYNECQICKTNNLIYVGTGIDKFYEYILKQYSNYKVLLVKNSIDKKIIKQIDSLDFDIIVGTSMVVNFFYKSNISLCLIFCLENLLQYDYYKIDEYIYNMISNIKNNLEFGSNLYIPTSYSESYLLNLAKQDSYMKFYNSQYFYRLENKLRPFYNTYTITFSNPYSDILSLFVSSAISKLKDHKIESKIVLRKESLNIYYIVIEVYLGKGESFLKFKNIISNMTSRKQTTIEVS